MVPSSLAFALRVFVRCAQGLKPFSSCAASYFRILSKAVNIGGSKTLKKLPPCWIRSRFFFGVELALSINLCRVFLCGKSLLLCLLVMGTVPLRILYMHSTMALISDSSAVFKIALHWCCLHLASTRRKSLFFFTWRLILKWTFPKCEANFISS